MVVCCHHHQYVLTIKCSQQDIKQQVITIKSEGNEHFKKMEYEKAISTYENALNLCKGKDELKEEQGTILKNKAACFLKMVMCTA